MEEVIRKLKEDGIVKGLCQPWQLKLRNGVSMKRLAELYVKGIDFCISNDYPTLDFIRANFKGKCEPYGIFVDEQHLNATNLPDAVLQGDCKGELHYNGFSVCRAYIRHNSEVTIKVRHNAHLTVDVFDNARLNLEVIGTKARVLVNVYGNDACVVSSGVGIKVSLRNQKTY